MKRFADVMRVTILAAGLAGVTGPCIAADAASWSYAGNTGPAKWGKLNKEYALCGTGTLQSPIDIVDKDVSAVSNRLQSLSCDGGTCLSGFESPNFAPV